MNKAKLVAVLTLFIFIGTGCTQTVQNTTNNPTTGATTTPTVQNTDSGSQTDGPGIYEDYSEAKLASYNQEKLVLFFAASWCPTCRGLDANIKDNLAGIPSDVAILKVDYDSQTALKQKYGVTYQHTLVRIDNQGNQLSKWSNSPTLASIVSEANK